MRCSFQRSGHGQSLPLEPPPHFPRGLPLEPHRSAARVPREHVHSFLGYIATVKTVTKVDVRSQRNQRALRFLEALAIKLQRSTVFRDSADHIFWSTRRHVSFNFKCDLVIFTFASCRPADAGPRTWLSHRRPATGESHSVSLSRESASDPAASSIPCATLQVR
jgi:hypothetical protein